MRFLKKKTLYRVSKGRHKSRPLRFKFGFGNFQTKGEIIVTQGEDAIYTFKDDEGKILPDQWDWLKVLGRKLRLDPHKETFMLATRYNPITELFEYTVYYHHRGKIILGDGSSIGLAVFEDMTSPFEVTAMQATSMWQSFVTSSKPMVTRKPGEPLVIKEIARHHSGEYGFTFIDDDTYSSIELDKKVLWFKIFPWFGGNRKSPIDWVLSILNW